MSNLQHGFNNSESNGFWFTAWSSQNPPSAFADPGNEYQLEKVKILSSVIKKEAEKQKDQTVVNIASQIASGTYSGYVALKAEILFNITPIKANSAEWLTYNEIRLRAYTETNRNQFNWIRNGGKYANEILDTNSINGTSQYSNGSGAAIDLIATKLFEKDAKYSLKNGRVNCSCNLFLSKLNAEYSINGSNVEVFIPDPVKRDEINEKMGFATGLNTGSYTKLTTAILAPNLCSIEINGQYYSIGLDKSGRLSYIADRNNEIKNLGYNTKASDGSKKYKFINDRCIEFYSYDYSKTITIDMSNLRVTSLVSNMTANQKSTFIREHDYPSSHTPDTPYIFEGWDYIYSGPVVIRTTPPPSTTPPPPDNKVHINYFEYEESSNQYTYLLSDNDITTKESEIKVTAKAVSTYTLNDLKGNQVVDGNTKTCTGVTVESRTALVKFDTSREKTVNFVYEKKKNPTGKIITRLS